MQLMVELCLQAHQGEQAPATEDAADGTIMLMAQSC